MKNNKKISNDKKIYQKNEKIMSLDRKIYLKNIRIKKFTILFFSE